MNIYVAMQLSSVDNGILAVRSVIHAESLEQAVSSFLTHNARKGYNVTLETHGTRHITVKFEHEAVIGVPPEFLFNIEGPVLEINDENLPTD